ncbi:MAG TPA: hypothetical protein VGT02_12530 [Methylomirabilota bacterium]|jgi:hypothetical protein|nr:hypothetical protein [Methylomirabilota bacterium]
MGAHFDLPLDLPHAATISARIVQRLQQDPDTSALAAAHRLCRLLVPYHETGENPATEEAALVVDRAARLGRAIVEAVERAGVGHDRLGQAIRNLFECLSMGEEGAAISLRAGEDPHSALRPV